MLTMRMGGAECATGVAHACEYSYYHVCKHCADIIRDVAAVFKHGVVSL